MGARLDGMAPIFESIASTSETAFVDYGELTTSTDNRYGPG